MTQKVKRNPRFVAMVSLLACLAVVAVGHRVGSLPSDGDAGWRSVSGEVAAPSPDELTTSGLEAFRRGDLLSAELAFAAAVERAPDDARALYNLGTVRSAQGNLASARDLFRKASQLDPASFDALFNLGVTAAAMSDSAEAERAYRRALVLKPESADSLWNLGLLLYDQGRVAEARPLLDNAIGLQPALASRLPSDVTLD